MSVFLVPIPLDRFPAWLRRSAEEYAADLVAMGKPPHVALREAEQGMSESFPGGMTAPEHHVFDICDGPDRVVGYLWIGPSHGADAHEWWLWDIVIDESERGKGLGRAAMFAAEEFALTQGVTTVGLSVFGFNAGAQRLYASLGYEVTSIKMSKTLAKAPPEESVGTAGPAA